MINLYAYTYPSAMAEFPGYALVKFGDSTRDVAIRIHEQGGSAEWEEKVIIGAWPGLKKISRDYQVHEELKNRGLHHEGNHRGTEWFKIPAPDVASAFEYLDAVVALLEGRTVRPTANLRNSQARALTTALSIIQETPSAQIVANLCPRFGKTIWALTMFNRLNKRVMLLPAYWLAVHSSFEKEIKSFAQFSDIRITTTEEEFCVALNSGYRAVVPMSLHGGVEEWSEKNAWIARIPNKEVFVFTDEGDFGTHAENQKAKLEFIFGNDELPPQIFASGTNVSRLAKCATKTDGVIYTAYSTLEQEEQGIIQRRFFMTSTDQLRADVEKMDERVMPTWTKIWGSPYANQQYIRLFFRSMMGIESLRPELNLSAMAGTPIQGVMLLVSADKAPMNQIGKIATQALPNHLIIVLNGDHSSNNLAERDIGRLIERAKIEGKIGYVIIANQMGSRSFTVSSIAAVVIAYDRGSVDATSQKVSRCLSPGRLYDGSMKSSGIIVDMSLDPNRSENIERLLIEEAVVLMRSGVVPDFAKAVRYMLSSINLFDVNAYGAAKEVAEADLFRILGDQENLLAVANMSVDVQAIVDSGVLDILRNVKKMGKASAAKAIVGEGAINRVTESLGVSGPKNKKSAAVKEIEDIVNNAIQSLSSSATSVYYLADLRGESYKECLEYICEEEYSSKEFLELFGIKVQDAIMLVDKGLLNTPILDVIIQNSKPKAEQRLFV